MNGFVSQGTIAAAAPPVRAGGGVAHDGHRLMECPVNRSNGIKLSTDRIDHGEDDACRRMP
ncbi:MULTISPECIES: hypothetical protein [Methylobacterium]|uniref:hypothetical protein n=1 Tax=Methylobacterium TaxID=407 RepID=UPI0011135686|nr:MULTISPECIES: hypothetical protein [Methylobacterium]MBK3397952.1 hypothetical protein [Methylobacterium ajmalii]MBK3411225.1 hypothetical protein [Methylobacterium ajmalii]MBK3422035.1 hypothetical protein [Methylobacterium ajmalii]MBZ6416032.1 hypothetical protein [Methylobacterium sp.]